MRIGIVTTGGTVSGDQADELVRSAEGSGSVLGDWVRGLSAGSELVVRSPIEAMSEDLRPRDWVTIALAVRELVYEDGVDGVLVLHGTDTMAYTAAALTFLTADLACPVVVTGSNVPARGRGSDAETNVTGALVALAHLERGCRVSFAGRAGSDGLVIAGTRARKVGTGHHAFRSIGLPPVATVTADGTWTASPHAPSAPPIAADVHLGMHPGVGLIQVHPGIDFRALRQSTVASGLRAVVLQLFPALTAPAGPERFGGPEFAAWATGEGLLVLGCPVEPVLGEIADYESTVALRDAGMTILPRTLPEVAYAKACWVSSMEADVSERRRALLAPVDVEHLTTVPDPANDP